MSALMVNTSAFIKSTRKPEKRIQPERNNNINPSTVDALQNTVNAGKLSRHHGKKTCQLQHANEVTCATAAYHKYMSAYCAKECTVYK